MNNFAFCLFHLLCQILQQPILEPEPDLKCMVLAWDVSSTAKAKVIKTESLIEFKHIQHGFTPPFFEDELSRVKLSSKETLLFYWYLDYGSNNFVDIEVEVNGEKETYRARLSNPTTNSFHPVKLNSQSRADLHEVSITLPKATWNGKENSKFPRYLLFTTSLVGQEMNSGIRYAKHQNDGTYSMWLPMGVWHLESFNFNGNIDNRYPSPPLLSGTNRIEVSPEMVPVELNLVKGTKYWHFPFPVDSPSQLWKRNKLRGDHLSTNSSGWLGSLNFFSPKYDWQTQTLTLSPGTNPKPRH